MTAVARSGRLLTCIASAGLFFQCAATTWSGTAPAVTSRDGERRVVFLNPIAGPSARPPAPPWPTETATAELKASISRARPSWSVLPVGPAVVGCSTADVATIAVDSIAVVSSNRLEKNLATTWSVLLPPVALFNIGPVRETRKALGSISLQRLPCRELSARVYRSPLTGDFAINTTGLDTVQRGYEIDLSYEEGVWADDTQRLSRLTTGLGVHVAAALVEIAEARERR